MHKCAIKIKKKGKKIKDKETRKDTCIQCQLSCGYPSIVYKDPIINLKIISFQIQV